MHIILYVLVDSFLYYYLTCNDLYITIYYRITYMLYLKHEFNNNNILNIKYNVPMFNSEQLL